MKNGQAYLLKQPYLYDASYLESVTREAMFYELVKFDARFSDVRHIFPNSLDFDSQRKILILDYTVEGKSLWQQLSQYRPMLIFNLIEEMQEIGKLLATFHSIVVSSNEISNISSKLHRSISQFTQPQPQILSQISAANFQLLKIIQQQSGLCTSLEQLQSEWQVQSFIHGDLRFDNIVIIPKNQDRNSSQIKIVDWEFADLGDPAWDIATVFQELLSCWIYGLSDRQAPEDASANEQILKEMQAAMRSFWYGYRRMRLISGIEANKLLRRSVRYCASRLVHAAYESLQYSFQLSYAAIYHVQVGANILRDQDSGSVHLLGIPFSV